MEEKLDFKDKINLFLNENVRYVMFNNGIQVLAPKVTKSAWQAVYVNSSNRVSESDFKVISKTLYNIRDNYNVLSSFNNIAYIKLENDMVLETPDEHSDICVWRLQTPVLFGSNRIEFQYLEDVVDFVSKVVSNNIKIV